MNAILTTEVKRCTKCGCEYPPTTDYFRLRTSGKLHSRCRACERVYSQSPERKAYDAMRRQSLDRNAYQKAYRQSSKYKAYQKVYHQSPECKAHDQARSQSPERKARQKAYRQTPKCKTREKAYQQSPEVKAARKANNNRREARQRALPATFSATDWRHALDYFGGACAVCGRPPGLWHTIAADHWIPLSSPDCPGTIPGNIVPLCHGVDGCNNSKKNRDAHEWLVDKVGERNAAQIEKRVQAYSDTVTAERDEEAA